MTYDAAGNVTKDNLGNTPTYDQENRISTVAGYTYSYDADGVRMEKAAGTSGTMYWTGPGGETLIETDLTGTINEQYIFFNGERLARVDRPSGTPHYYFSDHLGSASKIVGITGASATVQEQYYYYPYGGTQSQIGSDPNHYKFTGKERDSESNLDNFGARYYGFTMGRFLTPDWAARPTSVPYAVFGDPQSLNLYGYVRNDPVSRADANGHCYFGNCDSSGYNDGPGSLMNGMAAAMNGLAVGTHQVDDTTVEDLDFMIEKIEEALEEASTPSAQNKPQYDPKKSGPEDPTNPGHPLSQNPVYKKASDDAWQKTTNGTARNGRAEAGGTIEYKDGKIYPANQVNSVNGDAETANHLQITTDANTIAIYHTHGNSLDPRPSPGDRSPNTQVPDFVRSQRSLYVTIPGTAHGNPSLNDYIELQ